MVFIFVFIVCSNLYHMFLIDARKIKVSTYPSAKLCVLLVSHVRDSIVYKSTAYVRKIKAPETYSSDMF